MTKLICTTCENEYYVAPSRVLNSKHCSRICRKKGKILPCSWCKKLVYRLRHTLNRKFVFCSTECNAAYKHTYITGNAHHKFQATLKLPALSPEQKSMILGSVLGDASLPIVGTGNAFFQVGHSVKQREYLEYKRTLLSPISSQIDIYRRYDPRHNTTYETHRFHTCCHWWLTELRQHLYIDGKKQLTQYAIENLTPCALAFWFMDDGNICNKSTLSICTVSFQPSDVQAAANRLADWNLEAWEKRGRLFISAASKPTFRAWIAPWLHSSMRYKVAGRHLSHTIQAQLAWDF